MFAMSYTSAITIVFSKPPMGVSPLSFELRKAHGICHEPVSRKSLAE